MRILRLFGLQLESAFPFETPLPASEGPADLSFQLSESAAPLFAPGSVPIFENPNRRADGKSLSSLYREGEDEVLVFPFGLEYGFEPGRITCRAVDDHVRTLAEGRLLGPVLSYWLERQGVRALHASGVAVAGSAAGFLSSQGGGKSGLAAALVQAGHPLLTDDILPVAETGGAFLGRSGYPQMKMWPDEAAHFFPDWERLPRVHPQITKRRVTVGAGHWGAFHDSALPLAALYLPERREGGPIEISPLSRSQAVIELVRHSFSPHIVQAVGLQPSRLDFFARLVRQVPVRRLAYPSGFERLPEVAEAVRRDLRSA